MEQPEMEDCVVAHGSIPRTTNYWKNDEDERSRWFNGVLQAISFIIASLYTTSICTSKLAF